MKIFYQWHNDVYPSIMLHFIISSVIRLQIWNFRHCKHCKIMYICRNCVLDVAPWKKFHTINATSSFVKTLSLPIILNVFNSTYIHHKHATLKHPKFHSFDQTNKTIEIWITLVISMFVNNSFTYFLSFT